MNEEKNKEARAKIKEMPRAWHLVESYDNARLCKIETMTAQTKEEAIWEARRAWDMNRTSLNAKADEFRVVYAPTFDIFTKTIDEESGEAWSYHEEDAVDLLEIENRMNNGYRYNC